MIRHVVMFRFEEGTPQEARQSMAEGLAGLPARIDVIRRWSQGFNAVSSARNYDFCLLADFDSLEDLQIYQDHPAHQEVVAERVRPIVAAITVVDFSE